MSWLLFSVPEHLLSSCAVFSAMAGVVGLQSSLGGKYSAISWKKLVSTEKDRRRKGTGGEQMHRYEKSAADLWDSGLRTAEEFVTKEEP